MSKSKSSGPAFDMQHWLWAVVHATGLTKQELVILLCYQRYSNSDTGANAFPSTETLARTTGIHVSDLRGSKGAVQKLVNKGWLVRTREASFGRPAVYRLGYGDHRPIVRGNESPSVGESPMKGERLHRENTSVGETPTSSVGETPTSSVGETPTSSVGETPTRSTQDRLSDRLNDRRAEPEPIVQGVIVFDHGDDVDPDAEARELAEQLADVIGGYASQRPTPTRKWIAAFTRLMARENITRRQVEYVIDYLPRDDFWPGVIFDAPKFVEKYDQVSVRAKLAYRKDHTPNRHMDQKQRMDDQKARWLAEATARDAQLNQKAITA